MSGNIEMFRGGGCRPAPSPPGCFSELYRLDQCWDDVQAMRRILAKVITDLVQTDPSVIQAILAEIAKSGTSVPQLGVTNGSDAQPGQVGQWVLQEATGTLAGGQNEAILWAAVFQPGDWTIQAMMQVNGPTNSFAFQLTPVTIVVPGLEGLPGGGWYNPVGAPNVDQGQANSGIHRLNCSVPTMLPYQFLFNQLGPGTAGVPYDFKLVARRSR